MKNETGRLFGFLSCILTIIMLGANSASALGIRGKITDLTDTPIIGATVMVWQAGQMIVGGATDNDGHYLIATNLTDSDSVTISVRAIGYESLRSQVIELSTNSEHSYSLKPRSVEIGSVIVRPSRDFGSRSLSLSGEDIVRASQSSLVPTNPIAALHQPQLVRQGSSHSSKLRINGSNPRYFVNGSDIGHDPNHYGMFSIIPGSVVRSMNLYAQGTPSRFRGPTALELETPMPFGKRSSGELNLSLVEATGMISLSTDRIYSIGTLRKSVLDKLVRQLRISAQHRTLPPTNFQDIFLSSGVRLSPGKTLALDQYFTRDYLSYVVDETASNQGGLATLQHNDEKYAGLRFSSIGTNFLLKILGSRKVSHEEYRGSSSTGDPNAFFINLRQKQTIYTGSIEGTVLQGNSSYEFGGQVEYVGQREISLLHHNWNFLPPDAHSDNPYIYQESLNRLYGKFESNRTELNSAAFVTASQKAGRFSYETGVRLQQFGNLAQKRTLLFRLNIGMQTGRLSSFDLYLGTFAENPVSRILEPYQILVHHNLSRLSPIRTSLVSGRYQHGPVSVGLFAKRLTDVPVTIPDFSRTTIATSGMKITSDGFIGVRSCGTARFVGTDITLEKDDLLAGRLDIYSYYSYTHSMKSIPDAAGGEIAVPYELGAPHRFLANLTWELSSQFRFGSEATIRSGYSYTPTTSPIAESIEGALTIDNYQRATRPQNSARFPVNISLNLNIEYKHGRSLFYFNIANITNKANAMINTADGYVYDTGVLPTIGFRTRF